LINTVESPGPSGGDHLYHAGYAGIFRKIETAKWSSALTAIPAYCNFGAVLRRRFETLIGNPDVLVCRRNPLSTKTRRSIHYPAYPANNVQLDLNTERADNLFFAVPIAEVSSNIIFSTPNLLKERWESLNSQPLVVLKDFFSCGDKSEFHSESFIL
jgi:hypothetical protein